VKKEFYAKQKVDLEKQFQDKVNVRNEINEKQDKLIELEESNAKTLNTKRAESIKKKDKSSDK
jgi:hypothetical protein